MGKDREGRFIPQKGKPTGNGRETELGLRPNLEGTSLEQDQDITERYTQEEQKPAPNVRVLHPNRNVHKGEEELTAPEPKPGAGAPSHTAKRQQAEGINEIARLDRDTFASLAGHRTPWSISMYLPTHQRGVEVNEQQDSIALKHLVRQVELALLSQALRATIWGLSWNAPGSWCTIRFSGAISAKAWPSSWRREIAISSAFLTL